MIKNVLILLVLLTGCSHFKPVNPQLLPAENSCLVEVQKFDLDGMLTHCALCLEYGDSATCYNGLAIVNGMRGNIQETVRLLNKAIKADPKFAQAYNNLGIVYYNQGKTKLACAYFDRAVKLDPGYTDARDNREIACETAVD